jgi:pyrrolidone-carboxylate peptidase
VLVACLVTLLSGPAAGAATAAGPSTPAGAGCRDASDAGTVEEQRLTRTIGADPTPVATRLLRASGFDRIVDGFGTALCALPDRAAARTAVPAAGRLLWEAAVRRAQDPRPPAAGQLPGDDDRPLYWARLSMTLALRQWTPRFGLTAADHAALEHAFEYASRGITSSAFRPLPGVRRLFVSGFDPFQLDQEIRRGNPAGAAVLRLDGRVLDVAGTRVQVQVVVLPVRYADFDQGIVEDAFRPHYVAGPQRADMVTTISQGRPGKFDLEVWNGRRRDVVSIGDNNNVWGGGTPTAPVVFPGVGPGPEFLHTSLPVAAMAAAGTVPFPVNVDVPVVEIPAGGTGPVTAPNGPTPGSTAVEGSGGGYLSNEVAYRDTLLRDEFAPALPAGHLHTPVLTMAPDDTADLTDPTFEKNRADIAAQVEQLLRAGLATVTSP